MGDSQKAIENMKGSVETASIQLGSALAPAVTDAANAVGDAADKFAQLDEGQQKLVIGAAATGIGAPSMVSDADESATSAAGARFTGESERRARSAAPG